MASETWQREQGRFVPQMSNWLKGQRWLDDAVMTAAKETEARERSAAALQAMQQKEEARRAAMDKEREALRPRFEAFAEKFHLHEQPGHGSDGLEHIQPCGSGVDSCRESGGKGWENL